MGKAKRIRKTKMVRRRQNRFIISMTALGRAALKVSQTLRRI